MLSRRIALPFAFADVRQGFPAGAFDQPPRVLWRSPPIVGRPLPNLQPWVLGYSARSGSQDISGIPHTIAKSAIGLAPGDNHSSAGSQYFVLEMLPQIRDLLGGKASLWNYVEHLRVLIYDERVLVFDEPTEI